MDELQPERSRHIGIMVRDEEQLASVRDKLRTKYKLDVMSNDYIRCDFSDPWGNRIQVVDLHDESLVWLLPYQEVQEAGIVFPAPDSNATTDE